MNDVPTTNATSDIRHPDTGPSLAESARRVVMLTAVCGFVEVIGYLDVGHIYPAIMTGNTVQLGLGLAEHNWARFEFLAFAIGSFFVGCMAASLLRRHLRYPPAELLIMAALIGIVSFVRLHETLRVTVELPLLAFALAMQGETISRFGAVSLQTLVVTNNMIKFSDAFVGRYLSGLGKRADKPALAEVVLPWLSWLTYSLAAAAGAVLAGLINHPFVIPIAILLLMTADLMRDVRR